MIFLDFHLSSLLPSLTQNGLASLPKKTQPLLPRFGPPPPPLPRFSSFFFFFFFFSPPSSTTSTHSLSFDILIDLFVFLNRQNAYLLREFIFIYILSLTQVFFLPRLLDGCFADE